MKRQWIASIALSVALVAIASPVLGAEPQGQKQNLPSRGSHAEAVAKGGPVFGVTPGGRIPVKHDLDFGDVMQTQVIVIQGPSCDYGLNANINMYPGPGWATFSDTAIVCSSQMAGLAFTDVWGNPVGPIILNGAQSVFAGVSAISAIDFTLLGGSHHGVWTIAQSDIATLPPPWQWSSWTPNCALLDSMTINCTDSWQGIDI